MHTGQKVKRKQSPVYLLRSPYHTIQIHFSSTTQCPPHSTSHLHSKPHVTASHSSPGLPGVAFCPNPAHTSPFSPFTGFWLLFLHFRSLPLSAEGGSRRSSVRSQAMHCCSSPQTAEPRRYTAEPEAARSNVQGMLHHFKAKK